MKKILVFGTQGMLGTELFNVLQEDYEIIPFSRFNLDLRKTKQIAPSIKDINPDIVINAAAFTDTEKAENPKFQEDVMLINKKAPEQMAIACEEIGALFIHYSTDFVFDGNPKTSFTENAEKNPLNFYGVSKAISEDLVQYNCSKSVIIRTSWLFGNSITFVSKMIKLAQRNNNIEVANDIFITATYVKDLAEKTKELINTINKYPNYLEKNGNIYHLINEGVYSLYEFTEMIFKAKGFTKTKVVPVSHDKFESEIKRPPKATLVNTRFEKLRPLKDALDDFLNNKKKVKK